jgi:RHH-type rel operon transcriptional repressor/antitoxin RelB
MAQTDKKTTQPDADDDAIFEMRHVITITSVEEAEPVRDKMSETITIRLPETMVSQLAGLAAKEGETSEEYVLKIVEEHVEDMEDVRLAEEAMEEFEKSGRKLLTLAQCRRLVWEAFWRNSARKQRAIRHRRRHRRASFVRVGVGLPNRLAKARACFSTLVGRTVSK